MGEYKIIILDEDIIFSENMKNYINKMSCRFQVYTTKEPYIENLECFDVFVISVETNSSLVFHTVRDIEESYQDTIIIFMSHDEISCTDYDLSRIFRIINKAEYKKCLKAILYDIEKVFDIVQDMYMTVHSDIYGIVKIPIKKINYVYSEKNYLIINIEKNVYYCRMKLRDFSFICNHRCIPIAVPRAGCIVNLNHVKSLDYTFHRILMSYGGFIQISRRKRKSFYQIYWSLKYYV